MAAVRVGYKCKKVAYASYVFLTQNTANDASRQTLFT